MWRIYYGDGSTHSQDAGPPMGDRARDVQAVVQDHPDVGKEMVTTTDFYVMRAGRWVGVDWWGLMDWLLDTGEVLFGRMIGDADYQRIVSDANADREKTGWLPRERRVTDG